MRRVRLGGTGIETSCLGFGCAALGSRTAPEAGLAALAAAHAGGVTWFDLAPVYGNGQAEAIAGLYLRAHRAEVQIPPRPGSRSPAGRAAACGGWWCHWRAARWPRQGRSGRGSGGRRRRPT